jgi:hypothetical protein
MTGFGGAASGFVAGATAATGFLGGIFVIAVLAVGLRAGGFGATATGMAGSAARIKVNELLILWVYTLIATA